MQHHDFVYRDYMVWFDGRETVCEEIGNTEEPLFQIGAGSVQSAIRMIDEMHEAVETNVLPVWFKTWMDQSYNPGVKEMARARLHEAAVIAG